jgi:phosphoglycolate phosphatase/putative hydrolase of the HAD superfamily
MLWHKFKAVIFDVDGTLYDQKKLRRKIFFRLLGYYSLHSWKLRDLKILMDFRRLREKNIYTTDTNIREAQYLWAAKATGVSPQRVRELVNKWIYQIPLPYLSSCSFSGVKEFFSALQQQGILTVIFSDYPAEEKISALGLSNCLFFCSTDREIDCFKPNPKGLEVIVDKLGISIKQCLLIGDRKDRDGECARRAGMDYLIKENKKSGKNYSFSSYQELKQDLISSCNKG